MAKPTARSRLLVAVSVAQLATNVTGLAVALRRRPSHGAARALAGLGALQVPGYLGERLVRRRLRPSG